MYVSVCGYVCMNTVSTKTTRGVVFQGAGVTDIWGLEIELRNSERSIQNSFHTMYSDYGFFSLKSSQILPTSHTPKSTQFYILSCSF